jgi:predicted O-methyltransferase YrrM
VEDIALTPSREITPTAAAHSFRGVRVVESRALRRYFDNNARLGAGNDIAAFAAWIEAQDQAGQAQEPSSPWDVQTPYLVYHAWKPGFLELAGELRAPLEDVRRGAAASREALALERALEQAGFATPEEPDLRLLVEKTDVFPAMQNRVELELLLRRVLDKKPRCVVEIGTARGGSLYCLTQVAARDALIVSIDLAGGPCGGGQTELECDVFRSFAGPEQTLLCLRGRSSDAHTRQALQAALGGRRIELLFIDGDHRYESVKADFFGYRDLVADGGWVVLHDVLALSGVHTLWRELEARYAMELIRDPEGIAPLSNARRDAPAGGNDPSASVAYGLGLIQL